MINDTIDKIKEIDNDVLHNLILTYRWFFLHRKKEKNQPEEDGTTLQKDQSREDNEEREKDFTLSNTSEIA